MDLKAGGMGSLVRATLAWLADDVKGLSASTPIIVFAHIPLWTISSGIGAGAPMISEQALSMLKRFGSCDGAQWSHSSVDAVKTEGNVTFHTARSTAFPQPAPGITPSPGPMVVPAEKLRSVLWQRDRRLHPGQGTASPSPISHWRCGRADVAALGI